MFLLVFVYNLREHFFFFKMQPIFYIFLTFTSFSWNIYDYLLLHVLIQVGEIGWGLQFYTDYRQLKSGHQIKVWSHTSLQCFVLSKNTKIIILIFASFSVVSSDKPQKIGTHIFTKILGMCTVPAS